jgi:hypothetical protein
MGGENCSSVGITKDVHVHSLRHTYATHLLEDGMDIITLKDLLGHQNETTLEYANSPARVNKNSAPTHFCAMQPQVADVESLEKNRNYRIKHLAITHLISYKTMQNGRIGHIDACDECGNLTISYNSCRNRHCPKCQGNKREDWIQARMTELLPVPYFHVVLPCQLVLILWLYISQK